jgi:MFS family permease
VREEEDTAVQRTSVSRLVRRFAVDVTPLRRSRDFRLIWGGEVVSQVGTQITTVALLIQVFDLTGSSAAVGAVGLVQLVPMILVALGIGPVIDRVDRRKVLIVAQIGQAGASALLLVGALMHHPPLALVFGAAALSAAFISVALPTRAAVTPTLVGAQYLPAAAALNQVMWTSAAVIGPAVGGLIVGGAGLKWAYAVDVASYGVALVCALALQPLLPERDEHNADERGIDAVLAGVRYLKGKRVLQSTFTIDIIAMVFGMPRALFPQLAEQQFHGSDAVVGLLFSAAAAGALIGALTSGWVGRVAHPGRAILAAVAAWGAGIVLFGFAGDRLLLALGCLALAGGADVISAVFRGTMQQLIVPDSLRGRLSALNILVVTGGPRVGDFEAGVMAQAFTPTVSVVSGGLLCIAGVGVIGLAVPRFARWRVGDPP